jgi:hypothetical protein
MKPVTAWCVYCHVRTVCNDRLVVKTADELRTVAGKLCPSCAAPLWARVS